MQSPISSEQPEIGFLKVSSKSNPASVAGAIAGMIKDGKTVDIQSVGAGAVNQAVKAIAVSRGFLSPVGIEIVCIPSFADIMIDGEYRNAIRFSVEPRCSTHAINFPDFSTANDSSLETYKEQA